MEQSELLLQESRKQNTMFYYQVKLNPEGQIVFF